MSIGSILSAVCRRTMLQWYSRTARSVVEKRALSPSKTLLAVRCFSVKELPWCAPTGSITRRSQPSPTTQTSSESSENDTTLSKPIEKFGIIAAISACKNRMIGMDGKLPWSAPQDRQIFKTLTRDSILILGRKTLEEHPKLGHIKHAKHCIVISKTLKDLKDYNEIDGSPNNHLQLCLARSLDDALVQARELNDDDTTESTEESEITSDERNISCWVAGGERLYLEALRHKSLKELRLSWIHMDVPLPETKSTPYARFPARYHWDNKFKEISKTIYPATNNTPAFEHCVYQPK